MESTHSTSYRESSPTDILDMSMPRMNGVERLASLKHIATRPGDFVHGYCAEYRQEKPFPEGVSEVVAKGENRPGSVVRSR